MHGEDMSVFFDAETVAHIFTVLRLPSPANTFAGIVGERDAEALDGLAMNRRRDLLYPEGGPDLRDGDEIVRADGRHFRVRGEPVAQNDGREFLVQIDEVRT